MNKPAGPDLTTSYRKNRWPLLLIVSLMLFTPLLLLSVDQADAAMYLNSAEPQCNGSDPTVVMCDDFEDGTWYEKNCDVANASGGLLQTDGWCGTIFADPTTPTNAAVCGNQGAVGTNCTASSGALTGGVGGRNMADHNLGPTQNTSYNEVYLRYYIHPSTGFAYGSQKMITINPCCSGDGGIFIGGVGSPFGDGAYDACPVYDCNTTDEIFYYRQNIGQALRLSQITGNWAYVEMRIKMNTPGQKNGIFQLWIDDCGTTGLGCTGSGTLRSNYSTVEWQCPTCNRKIGTIWFENWGNPKSVGTEFYDQIVIATRRIGPMGGGGGDTTPPDPPSDLRVR